MRWVLVAAPTPVAGALVLSLALLGCGTTVQPGLANAPALGGTTLVSGRGYDAIANGPDSCGRAEFQGSPAPNHWPACSRETGRAVSWAELVPRRGMRDDGEDQRWMEHYHFGWPCDPTLEPFFCHWP
jgi:hypothetical protein